MYTKHLCTILDQNSNLSLIKTRSNYLFTRNTGARRRTKQYHGDTILKYQNVGNSTRQTTQFPQQINGKVKKKGEEGGEPK